MRRYETIFITLPDMPEDEIGAIVERYTGIIEGLKGTIVKLDKWGKRKLAYEIRKNIRGYYVFYDYVAKPEVVTEFERNLKIDDNILKYITVKTDGSADLAVIQKELADAAAAKEAAAKAAISAAEQPVAVVEAAPAEAPAEA